MNPGYRDSGEVTRVKSCARDAVALGQAVPADHARILLDALAFCEKTIDEYARYIAESINGPADGAR